MSRVCKAVKAKGVYFEEMYFDLSNTFFGYYMFHMCYFIVLMHSLLFYNVENCKKQRKTLERVTFIYLHSCVSNSHRSSCGVFILIQFYDYIFYYYLSILLSLSCWERGLNVRISLYCFTPVPVPAQSTSTVY
jgi:hypothetical protein